MSEPAIKLNAELLAGLGYKNLTDEQYRQLLTEFYNAAEDIVGVRLASMMSDSQLDEFGDLFDRRDDAGAFDWLKRNFPNYFDIVKEVFAELEQLLTVTARQFREPALGSRIEPGVELLRPSSEEEST